MCRTSRCYNMWVHWESCADRNRYQFPVIITRLYHHLAPAFHQPSPAILFTFHYSSRWQHAEVLITDPAPYSPPARHRAKTFIVSLSLLTLERDAHCVSASYDTCDLKDGPTIGIVIVGVSSCCVMWSWCCETNDSEEHMEIEPWDVDAHILLSSYLYPIDGARRSLLLALITSCIRQPAEDNRSIDPRTCGRVRLRSCATKELPRDRVRRTCLWPVVFCVEESGRFSSFRSQAEVRLAHVASAWGKKILPDACSRSKSSYPAGLSLYPLFASPLLAFPVAPPMVCVHSLGSS